MYEALRSIALSHWESQLAPEAVALEFRMLLMSLLMLLTIVLQLLTSCETALKIVDLRLLNDIDTPLHA
jgi:hypothetical protein